MMTQGKIKKLFRRCTSVEEVRDTAAELKSMGIVLEPHACEPLRAGSEEKVIFIADVDVMEISKQRGCTAAKRSVECSTIKGKRIQIRCEGESLLVTTENVPQSNECPSMPYFGECEDEAIRYWEYSVTPEPVFTVIELEHENFVHFCLGNIAFSQEAVGKIGFDPVDIMKKQRDRINELTSSLRRMTEKLNDLDKNISEKDKEIEELSRPLHKKIISYILG